MGDPEVAANCSVVTYVDAAQDGGVGIDHHVVAEDGVTGDALDERTVGLLREVLGTKGYALVKCNVMAQYRCCTDDDTCAMVDGKRGADGGSRMDVW